MDHLLDELLSRTSALNQGDSRSPQEGAQTPKQTGHLTLSSMAQVSTSLLHRSGNGVGIARLAISKKMAKHPS